LVDGTLLATSWRDFTDGDLSAAINKTESGGTTPYSYAWTGTRAFGQVHPSYTCVDWTSATGGNGAWPASLTSGTQWAEPAGYVACNSTLPIICTEQPPPPARRVFVTSTFYNGNLGGISGADAKCQTRANAAGLSGTWMAWIGTSASNGAPKSRLAQWNTPFRRLDGTLLANNWNDLVDGSLFAPINVTEFNQVASGQMAWTGSTANGSSWGSSGTDWTSSLTGLLGTYGANINSNSTWTELGTDLCLNAKSLYCIEQ
jgi:hypothetical protein